MVKKINKNKRNGTVTIQLTTIKTKVHNHIFHMELQFLCQKNVKIKNRRYSSIKNAIKECKK
ncbi:MAG: hypothetical protein COA50_03340 [Flavobacteriaceae bacterium]|nr:MAG: hypothetical protein COA50_03340 [Flavobacteriaceae bacterium]